MTLGPEQTCCAQRCFPVRLPGEKKNQFDQFKFYPIIPESCEWCTNTYFQSTPYRFSFPFLQNWCIYLNVHKLLHSCPKAKMPYLIGGIGFFHITWCTGEGGGPWGTEFLGTDLFFTFITVVWYRLCCPIAIYTGRKQISCYDYMIIL